MQIRTTAVLLMNTGSPESSRVRDVARYLSRFLGDRRIISIPWLFRKILVNCIIVPVRCFVSAKRYKQLQGLFDGQFPLVRYNIRSEELLQERLGERFTVFLGMRYGNLSIRKQIEMIAGSGNSKIILFPLFPQYASSSTGSVLECALNALSKYPVVPEISTIAPFYDHPLFIRAFAERFRESDYESYEQILFSYHSLPLSQIKEVENTAFDYEKACRKTSGLIARELNLPDDRYSTCFQSQLSSRWQGPFADEIIVRMARSGVKSLLVAAPSFVADCLETSLELGVEAKEEFLKNGGQKYNLVNSLNDSSLWVDCMQSLVSGV